MDIPTALNAAARAGAVVTLCGSDQVTIKHASGVPPAVVDYLRDHKPELLNHLRQDSRCLTTNAHIQPGLWEHRDGRANCHICGKFMGYTS